MPWVVEQELSICLKDWERISILASPGSSQLYLNTGAYQKIKVKDRQTKNRMGKRGKREAESIKFMTHATREQQQKKEQEAATILFG